MRACKLNIKKLCPLHDMLPIIHDMELHPFKYHSVEQFGGIGCTLRAGHLQYECRVNSHIDTDESSISISAYDRMPPSLQLSNITANKYFRNHFSSWICTQSSDKYECKYYKEHYYPSSTHMEIPLDLNTILLPFMQLLKIGASNCNLYFSVKLNEVKNDHRLQVNCSPLDLLTVEQQIHTQRLTFKVLSCGTFRRNLQPMVHT